MRLCCVYIITRQESLLQHDLMVGIIHTKVAMIVQDSFEDAEN